MIDDELKNYIESLLKQGYDLKSIRESLIHAGHDIAKVEEISLFVFELFHKELIQYIDTKLSEGHSIEEIKRELIKIGHSEKKLLDILNYHKSKKPKLYFSKIGDVLNSEKLWVKHYATAYLITFLSILIALVIVSIIVTKNSEPEHKLGNLIDGCNSIKQMGEAGEYYSSLCLSLVSKKSNICMETGRWQDCEDSYNLYSYYLEKDSTYCESIKNINLKELCKQIDENACNNYFGYNGFCASIVASDDKLCSDRNKNDIIIESCTDNYRMFKALSNLNQHECSDITDVTANILCKTLTTS
jgi:hypothetical protein